MLTKPLLYLSECASTNNMILDYTVGDPSEFGLYTFNQNRGKGQYGNIWLCAPNLNLAYSLLFPAELINYSESIFNFHTALILRDFVANLTHEEVKIKWPNDIIIKSKKISGILIEKAKINSVSCYIIGIGLNVLQEDFSGLPSAGSLMTQTGKAFDLHTLAENLHETLLEHFNKPFSEEQVLQLYNEHLFRKDQVSVFQIKNVRQNGIIKGVTSDGFLELELEDLGLKRFFHKEIELLY